MKRFLKKSWHRIPVGVITAVLVLGLVAGGVFGAGNVLFGPVDQTITHNITNPNSITAPDFSLPNMKVGEKTIFGVVGEVIVDVGSDGGKWLHMSLDSSTATLYDSFAVTIQCSEESSLSASVYFGGTKPGGATIPDKLDASIGPLEVGTYTFVEGVRATAGNQAGTANVKVTFTLEDEE